MSKNERAHEGQPGSLAEFYERTQCISCRGTDLESVDSGRFDQGPHRREYERSPWGESPLPHLEGCTWELVRCRVCRQVYHKRVLTDAWEAVRFERWTTREAMAECERQFGADTPEAKLRAFRRRVEWVLTTERMCRGVAADKPVRWLDFGCGWGQTVELARMAGMQAFGVDKSSGRRDGAGNLVIFQTLEELRAQEAEPFHAASMFEVLEHLHDPLGVLEALHGVLAPGGLLIIEVPDGTGFDNITRSDSLGVADGLDHVNSFDPTTLTHIVERAGFTRIARQPTPQVTADYKAVVKREARRLLSWFKGPTTSQVFRRR